MTIVDRASGVSCVCKVGSYHMFGETWNAHIYDVPGLPIRAGDVVLDIGANQGFFTCYAAHQGAKVYAFEPVPQLYKRLVQNIERNQFANRVTALPCALTDSEGRAELIVTDALGGGQSTMVPAFAQRLQLPVTDRIQVECTTLPEVLKKYDIPSVRLCKIDAEGSEFRILSKLSHSDLDRIQGFTMEYHPEAYDLRSLIKLLLNWGTHQVSLMDERAYNGNVLRLISHEALSTWFQSESERAGSSSSRTGTATD